MTPEEEIERDCDELLAVAEQRHTGWGRLHSDECPWVTLHNCRTYAAKYITRERPDARVEILLPDNLTGWCFDVTLPTEDRLARYKNVDWRKDCD